jgi:hypothetical protein
MYQNSTPRKTVTGLALVVFIALALCFSLGAKSNSGQVIAFEYKVISQRVLAMQTLNQGQKRYPDAQSALVEMTLNNLGKEGWELLEMTESLLILKRKFPQ